MIAYLKGLMALIALLGSMRIAFHYALGLENFWAVVLVAFFITLVLSVVFLYLVLKSNMKVNYWLLGLCGFAFALFNLSYPIEYDRTLGWAYVGGMIAALLSLAIFFIFKPSDRHERTS